MSWVKPIDFNGSLNQGLTEGGYSGTAIPVVMGGTAKTSVTTVPAATSWAGWDANSNLSANSVLYGYSIPNANTTLTSSSSYFQFSTNSANNTYTLPAASALVAGRQFYFGTTFLNKTLVIKASGGTSLLTLSEGETALFTVWNTGGSDTTSWQINFFPGAANGVTAPLVVGYGGTGTTAVTTAPAATAFAGWDANKNLSSNLFIGATASISTNTTYTLAQLPQYILCTGASAFTLAIPTDAAANNGYEFYVRSITTSAASITITGSSSYTLLTGNTVRVSGLGGVWYIDVLSASTTTI